MSLLNALRHGGKTAWILLVSVIVVFALSGFLLYDTTNVRLERDVTRIVFNHNEELLDDIKKEMGASADSIEKVLSAAPDTPDTTKPYIVVSITDNRLWYKLGSQTLFTTRVATGSGKTLVQDGSTDHWKFDTPRGRLVVQSKDADPIWVPPDWHFMEMAQKKHLGVVRLVRGQDIPIGDGSSVSIDGNDVVQKMPDGTLHPFEVKEGHEIIAQGNIVIPPYGTNQRKYKGVMGNFRLDMGDGYGIHGTDEPNSIGHSASHGCVRLRNEDIETLYEMVPVGTPVYIY